MKKTTSTKQTRIGKAKYLNQQTGKVETFNVIEEYDQDFNFEKIWLTHLLESLDILGGAKIKVLKYLLQNKNSENQIIGTQRAIAQSVGVSLPVVNQTISALVEKNALKKVSCGVLMLNPELMFKGKHQTRMNVLLRYSKINTLEQDIKNPLINAEKEETPNDKKDTN